MSPVMEQSAKRAEIRRTIREMQSLPTIPSFLIEFEEAMRDPSVGAADIAAVIEKDMAMAGKVLKVVNSSFYGGVGGDVGNLKLAVSRLGLKEIRRLVVSLSYISTFPNPSDHVDPIRFWKHSQGVAVVARQLAIWTEGIDLDPDEMYTPGLLHDIGWLVLDQFMPGDAVSIVRLARQKAITRREAELGFLGVDHGEVGGVLLDRWHLPPETVEAVTWHHEPDSADDDAMQAATILRAADAICLEGEIGDSGEIPAGKDEVLATLEEVGYDADRALKVCEELIDVATREADIISALT